MTPNSSTSDAIVYLDYASTSPMRPEVLAAMAPFGKDRFANASGSHQLARDARQALEDAREVVAVALGAQPAEIVFTSGGTESSNLAIAGVVGARAQHEQSPGTLLCSSIEHAAVLETCRAHSGNDRGAAPTLREIAVDSAGIVDLFALESALDDEVVLVSIMLANNEVGTIQPLAAIAEIVRRRSPHALFHTDAVGAGGFLDLAMETACADLVSVSAHKLGGPKGSGALVVREGIVLSPLFYGGGQERERRSGTHDVAGAVGLGAALSAALGSRKSEVERVGALRDRLAEGVLAKVSTAVETVDRSTTLAGHCHLRFAGLEQEELLIILDDNDICASAGAACASGALESSHVLAAMGIPTKDARSSLRFSLGYLTTADDVDRAIEAIVFAADHLAA